MNRREDKDKARKMMWEIHWLGIITWDEVLEMMWKIEGERCGG